MEPQPEQSERWNRFVIERRIKAAFWSNTVQSGQDIDDVWLSYTRLRAAVAIGRSKPADKTFSAVLRGMVAEGLLEKETVPRRARYRLRLKLSENDVRAAVLVSDVQRIEMAASLGYESDLRAGWSLYGLPKTAPIRVRRGLRSLVRDVQEEILEIVVAEAEMLRDQTLHLLKTRLKGPDRRIVRDFLDWAILYRLALGNPPAQAGYAKGVERLVGPEFLEVISGAIPHALEQVASRHSAAVRRFWRPANELWSSSNPVVKGLGALFSNPDQITADERSRLRKEFRRRGIPLSKLEQCGQRWLEIMRSFSPTIVISSQLRTRPDYREIEAALRQEMQTSASKQI